MIAALVCAVTTSTLAADSPQVSLSVSPPFATGVTVKHYRKGQDLLHDPTFHLITVAALTAYYGCFGPRVADQANSHGWKVDVFAHYSPKVVAACTTLPTPFGLKFESA